MQPFSSMVNLHKLAQTGNTCAMCLEGSPLDPEVTLLVRSLAKSAR
jgi:hypothetical protein